MPKYDFKCYECGDTDEFSFSIHENIPSEIIHLECAGDYRRVFTATPAVFRGQGWAKMTEYKAKKS